MLLIYFIIILKNIFISTWVFIGLIVTDFSNYKTRQNTYREFTLFSVLIDVIKIKDSVI